MKILAFNSSYRKNGNTALVLEKLEERITNLAIAGNEPVEIETISLAQMNIQPCRGCRVCFDRGEDNCPMKDDLLALKAKIKAADCVIWASPVYVDDINGSMKVFIDRLAHICHRPEFFGISAFALVTSGVTSTSHSLGTFRTALMTWGFHLLGGAGFVTGARMKSEEIEKRHSKKLEKCALQIFTKLRRRDAERPSFLSLMVFKIQQRAWLRHPDDSFDYTFWKEKGWLEPGRTYYLHHHTSPIKVFLARAVGTAIAPFVS